MTIITTTMMMTVTTGRAAPTGRIDQAIDL
jgi:hypothetical protein